MRIGFHTNNLSFRGAEIAIFDYALHNQLLLQNESIIFYKSKFYSEPSVVSKFKKNFKIYAYQNTQDLARLADQEKLDLFYFIKSGARDGDILSNVPCGVHAVFPTKVAELHGNKLAFVSEWLTKEYSNGKVPFVPHMIDLPNVQGNLRVELNIPKNATVLASYGGQDSFNLPFVHKAILKALAKRNDLYFIFMNFAPFAQHDRILFLPGNSDIQHKVRFINTADGMIHARGIGESFGLACGEFSIKKKPVITYAMSPQRSHIEILGSKALLYKGSSDLETLLLNFTSEVQYEKNWDAYSEHFSPSVIMSKFDSVFVKGSNYDPQSIGKIDQFAIEGYRLMRKLRSLSKKIYV